MEKKKIIVPEPLNVKFEGSNLPERKLYFAEFIVHLIETNEVFNKSARYIRSGVRIDAAARKTVPLKMEEGQLVDAPAENVMILDIEDWTVLKNVALEPENGYVIKPAKNILHWIEAIENAETISTD